MQEVPRFEELDYRETPMGELILRRRTVLSLENREIYEVILGDAFLMSSMFTVVEQELSRFGLKAVEKKFQQGGWDVLVGGLGLGYTARAALEFPQVGQLVVMDYLKPVIEWHEKELVPVGKTLNKDERCQYVHHDFFAWALGERFSEEKNEKWHAVLLDIDHSPKHLLSEQHGEFYSEEGMKKFAEKFHEGGIFGLWSDDPPEESFLKVLKSVFQDVESHVVSFENPIEGRDFESTVYLGRKGS